MITNKKMYFSLKNHFWFLLLGINLFSLNYIFFYIANQYLISGIVAVCFSVLIFMNILNERIFFKIKATFNTYFASLIGLLGLFIIFNKEIIGFTYSNNVHFGILLGIIATYFVSIGNIISLRNSKNNLPIISSLSYAMLYGSLFTFVISVFLNKKITIDISLSYITSLLFLSIIGSVLAFTLYLKLIEQIGAGRAGYIGAVLPVVALLISTYFENLVWNKSIIFGLPLLILGAIIVINQKQVVP
jgi:drug/metabolite transporter (DMT)-like permease